MKRVKIIFGVFSALMITALLFSANIDFFRIKTGEAKYGDFFQNPSEYDVIFLGSSHTVMGVLPMELWEEYGICSYNLGNYGQWLPVDYWVLRNILEVAEPELVVLDVWAIQRNDKYSEAHLSYLHEIFDSIPLSSLKREAILDLFPAEMHRDFLFPYSVYHSRWREIDQTFFEHSQSTLQKGADENAAIGTNVGVWVNYCEPVELLSAHQTERYDNAGTEYLRKIIELCQEHEVDILLSAIPYVAPEKDQKSINAIYEIAQEYHIKFYNGLTEEIINPHTDMWDVWHLNSSGAKKWTKALGAYMIDNYPVSTYKGDETKEHWNDTYEKFMEKRWEVIKSQKSVNNYLMLMANKNIDVCVYVKEDTEILEDKQFCALLKNLFQDAGEGVNLDISFTTNVAGDRYIVLGELEENLLMQMEKREATADIQIIAVDTRTNTIRDIAEFNQNAAAYTRIFEKKE